VFWFLVIWFFRVPQRNVQIDPEVIYAPADGKVVAIEEITENEYFKEKRKQISIFMSPLNVHANYYPTGGEVKYKKYHPGRFLVAWHPKSSDDNEMATVVVRDKKGRDILFRQIAGAVARRIVTYSETGTAVQQTDEMGFIKFGSRVDVFVPTNAKINVKLNDTTRARETILAKF
jgi:phosphatidylserine decarboxylase